MCNALMHNSHPWVVKRVPCEYCFGAKNCVPGQPKTADVVIMQNLLDDYFFSRHAPSTSPTGTEGTTDTMNLDGVIFWNKYTLFSDG